MQKAGNERAYFVTGTSDGEMNAYEAAQKVKAMLKVFPGTGQIYTHSYENSCTFHSKGPNPGWVCTQRSGGPALDHCEEFLKKAIGDAINLKPFIEGKNKTLRLESRHGWVDLQEYI